MFGYYVRLAAKSVMATPWISLVTVAGIALGIAVPTALLSVHHVFAQNPIPGKSDRLFNVRVDSWEVESEFFNILPGDPPKHITYRDMRGLMASDLPQHETGVASAAIFVFPERKDARPFQTVVQLVHADFFPMFDAPFRHGSGWSRDGDASGERVVVLSSPANERLFGGEDSVGRQVRLGTQSFRVVGVLAPWKPTPQYFDVINNALGDVRDFFVPFELVRDASIGLDRTGDADSFGNFDSNDPNAFFDVSETHWVQYWVELEPAQAGAYRDFVDAYAAEQKRGGRFPRPLNNRLSPVMEWMRVRAVVPPATVGLLLISFLFLAVCCLNLTALLLGKFLSRSGVLGVHRALGAPRSAIFYQRLLECEIVGLVGGVVGVGLSGLALMMIERSLPPGFGREGLFGMSGYTLLSAFVLALLAGLVSGVYPAWRACRVPPAMQLKIQ